LQAAAALKQRCSALVQRAKTDAPLLSMVGRRGLHRYFRQAALMVL